MVRWSGSATHDLRQIYDYIARDSKYYGKKVVHDILVKSDKLEDFPMSGKIFSELNDPKIREVFVYSYRMIYQIVSDEEIEILAIVHTRRDFSMIE